MTERRVDLRQISRYPKSFLLAGLVTVSVVSCSGSEAKASDAANPKCPTTPAEVSYLVGGDPENWKPIEGIKGSWRFRSDVGQILNGASIGRIDTPAGGRIHPGFQRGVIEAWYVCPTNEQLTEPASQNPQ